MMNTSNWETSILENQNVVNRRLLELTDASSRNQLEDAFLRLQKTNLEITQELIDILIQVKNTQMGKRIVNTAGTAVGALGALSMVAGVCLAPTTGGLSLLFGFGIGASVTSGAAAIGTTVYAHHKHKAYVERIGQLQQQQNHTSDELNCKLGIINSVVVNLRRAGVPKATAFRAAFSVMRDRLEDQLTGPNGEISAEKVQVLVQQVYKALNNVYQAGGMLTTAYAIGADSKLLMDIMESLSSAAAKVGEAGAKGVENSRQLLQTVGQGISSSTSKVVLKRVGAVTGVIFTAIDIAFLIKEWKTPDPLIEHIVNVVNVLMEDSEKCERMVNVIRHDSQLPQICI